jgi:hypothetical protein
MINLTDGLSKALFTLVIKAGKCLYANEEAFKNYRLITVFLDVLNEVTKPNQVETNLLRRKATPVLSFRRFNIALTSLI